LTVLLVGPLFVGRVTFWALIPLAKQKFTPPAWMLMA
jgi:hypothetical protein